MDEILEYAEIEGFTDNNQVPDFDTEGIINDILGNTEWGKKTMDMKKLTKIDIFLLVVGIGCLLFGIVGQNMILGGVAVFCVFLVVARMLLKKDNDNDNDDQTYY